MRKVRCHHCGKGYNYDQDEFCPKCGAFNPPPKPGQPVQAARPVQPAQRPTLKVCSTPELSAGNRQLLPLLGLILVGVIALWLLSYFSSVLPFGEPETVLHALEEPFQVNDLTITIDGVAWVPLDPESSVYRPGYRCLAVSVWITGGAYREDLHMDTPMLTPLEGDSIPLEDDPLLTRKLKEYDIYSVSLWDALWEDPLMGEFVFFVPEEADDLGMLLIEEYAPGLMQKPRLRTTHQVMIIPPEE